MKNTAILLAVLALALAAAHCGVCIFLFLTLRNASFRWDQNVLNNDFFRSACDGSDMYSIAAETLIFTVLIFLVALVGLLRKWHGLARCFNCCSEPTLPTHEAPGAHDLTNSVQRGSILGLVNASFLASPTNVNSSTETPSDEAHLAIHALRGCPAGMVANNAGLRHTMTAEGNQFENDGRAAMEQRSSYRIEGPHLLLRGNDGVITLTLTGPQLLHSDHSHNVPSEGSHSGNDGIEIPMEHLSSDQAGEANHSSNDGTEIAMEHLSSDQDEEAYPRAPIRAYLPAESSLTIDAMGLCKDRTL